MSPESTPQKKWLIFFLVAVAVFMSTLDGSIVNLALPSIMKDLNESMSVMGWILTVYLLTIASLLLAFGRLSDIKGRRWVYLRGFMMFTAGSLGCGLASNAATLIAARSFQGIGSAMLMACSQAIIVDTFPASERGKALGMVGTVVAAGLTAGPALGGLILEYYSWMAIFFVNIPIGIAATLMGTAILIKEPAELLDRTGSFDWAGAVLMAVSSCSMLIGVSMMRTWGYASIQFLCCLGIFLAGFSVLVRIELRSANPLFEPSLLRIRMFVLPNLSVLLLFVSLYAVMFLMPFYLVNPAKFSIDHSGYIMTIPFLVLSVVAPFSGALSDRIGSRSLCTAGMIVMVLSLFALSGIPAAASLPAVAWRLGLVGMATGLFISPNGAAAMSSVPSNRRGIASSTIATARNMGMVIGVAVANLIFNATFQRLSGGLTLKNYDRGMESVFMMSFRNAMFFAGAVAVLGAGVAMLRGNDNRR